MKNYYQPLSLSPSASPEEIKSAYLVAVLKIHSESDFPAKFVELNEAYSILSNPVTRKKYDKELKAFYVPQSSSLSKKIGPFLKNEYWLFAKKVKTKLANRRFKPKAIVQTVSVFGGIIIIVLLLKNCTGQNKTNVVANSEKENAITTAPATIDTAALIPKTPAVEDTVPQSDMAISSIAPCNIIHPKNYYSPFTECFGSAIRGGNATLTVYNHFETDAVICLYNTQTGVTIRNNYVSAGSTIYLTDIPQGWYKIRVLFGNDWCNDVESPCGSKGYFTKNIGTYEKDGSEFFKDDGNQYSNFSYTLYQTPTGNSSKSPISSSKFFNR